VGEEGGSYRQRRASSRRRKKEGSARLDTWGEGEDDRGLRESLLKENVKKRSWDVLLSLEETFG